MAVMAIFVLLLSMTSYSSATWCICKDGISDNVLQKTLDYACGNGADCNPIHPTGTCYGPNTLKAHCNYAVNSFFQKKGQAQGTCDFTGTATVITSDPSTTGCSYPSSATSGTTPSTTTPVSGTPTPVSSTPISTTPPAGTTPYSATPIGGNTPYSATPVGNTPYSATPAGGIIGGAGTGSTGLGPSGMTDLSKGVFLLKESGSLLFLVFVGLVFLWV
ncbi:PLASMODESMATA CALLOSE-BINDING PROTEIN 2-like [Impatiens glandulifera]|uniref:PLASMODESMATA CALLOSE-BINDING PROTEIN 2-like n=1 Tax=Impatiens glandulifera TaxID=253017 RepID=UPI001FB081F5|nr:PLASMODESMATA CALLOSE-BINDING PROTEIN 2-like [Impatiens glandulifera]